MLVVLSEGSREDAVVVQCCRHLDGSLQQREVLSLVVGDDNDDGPSRVQSNGRFDEAVLELCVASGVTRDMAFYQSQSIQRQP